MRCGMIAYLVCNAHLNEYPVRDKAPFLDDIAVDPALADFAAHISLASHKHPRLHTVCEWEEVVNNRQFNAVRRVAYHAGALRGCILVDWHETEDPLPAGAFVLCHVACKNFPSAPFRRSLAPRC